MDRRSFKKRTEEEDGDDCKQPAAAPMPSHRYALKPAALNNNGADDDEGDLHSDFDNGDRVVIVNLVDAPELNGKKGVIVQYHSAADRFTVELDKDGLVNGTVSTVFIKPMNLTTTTTTTMDQQPTANGQQNFAEVFPDSVGVKAPSSAIDNDAKAKAVVASGQKAIMPGAVAVQAAFRDSDSSVASAKYGQDEGLKGLPLKNANGGPETFADTTGRTNGSIPGAESVTGGVAQDNDKKDAGAGGEKTNNNVNSTPGAVREGSNLDLYNSYDDEDDEKLRSPGPTGFAIDMTTSDEELAIAAEVVEDEEDVEAKVQAEVEERLQRESNIIESQVQQRMLDEAVHADAVVDDSEEKMVLFRRKIMCLGCFGVVLVTVILVIVFVFVLDDDSSITANPTFSPTLSLLPSSSPTFSPSTTPTFSPTPIPRCTLCADGSIPENITSTEFFTGGSCSDFMDEQERQFNVLDSECLEGQALAWLHCDCPTLPPLPDDPSCTLCSDGSIPTEDVGSTELNGTCANYNTYVAIMSNNPLFGCSILSRQFADICTCPLEPGRFADFSKIVEPISGEALLDETSAQYKALSWLASKDPAYLSIATSTDEEIQERYVAALLYFATDGQFWNKKNNFLAEDDICSWNDEDESGIFCKDDDVVYNISLSDNNLVGFIPNEIMVLTNLQRIRISSNALNGTVPEDIGKLPLELFTVWQNQLTGTLPESFFTSPTMKELYFSDNPWKNGSTTIPATIGSASSLEVFRCDNCGLVSSIPESVVDLVNLKTFSLEENSLTGFVPSFAKTTKMEYLYLRNNNLTGPIPESLASLTSLIELFLSSNSLNSTIPRGVASLSSLTGVDITRNFLTGEVPPFRGTELAEIWLYGNLLSGSLDEFFNSTSSTLTFFRFDDNFLSGTISSQIGRFTNLTYLGMGNDGNFEGRRNSIGGTIPTEIGLMKELQQWYTYDLDLQGPIPSEIGYLSSLELFSAADNFLGGAIPSELGKCTSLYSLFLHLNQFSGTIPRSVGSLPELETMATHGNGFEGNFDNVFCRRQDAIDTLWANCDIACGCCTVCCSRAGDNCVVPTPTTLSPTTTPTYAPTISMVPVAPSRIDFVADLLEPVSGDSLLDETSPQYDALLWTARRTAENATTEVIQERYVGALLYFSTGGPSWDKRLSFLTEDEVCSWNDGEKGIFCDNGTAVDRISLYDNNLIGSIPEEVATLTNLRIIELSNNMITGTIPEVIGGFSFLDKVDLASNLMTGTLPDSIFKGPMLKEVLLSGNLWNNVSATIPSSIGDATNLEVFECESCNLTSSIPESISNLVMLRRLDLDSNSLTGLLPSFSNNVNMEYLNLYYNNLDGLIPESLGNMASLETLWVHGNSLNSTIPRKVGSLPSLKSFDMGDNRLYGNIPPFYGTELDEIWLLGNALSGNLDEFFASSSTSLETIRFDANLLSGTISNEIGRFTNLNILHLGQHLYYENRTNLIKGTIPTEVGLLVSIKEFRLNLLSDLVGVIPSEMGLLTNMTTLGLFNTSLTGTIPAEMGQLTNLEVLDLGQNDLSGSVPWQMGNCESLTTVSFSLNELNGSFPESVASLPELELLWIAVNGFTNDFEELFCGRLDPIDNLTVSCDNPCSCCTACCWDLDNCTDLTTSTLSPAATPTLSPGTTTMSPTTTPMPTIDCSADSSILSVLLTTDSFPSETSWDVVEVNTGSTLLLGGPYSQKVDSLNTFRNDVCLPSISDSCYLFTIYDVHGDGICCGSGIGEYKLLLNGEEIESGGQFEESETVEFGNCDDFSVPGSSANSECTNDPDWVYINSKGESKTCSFVEISISRCDKIGANGVPACCACCEACEGYTGDCSC